VYPAAVAVIVGAGVEMIVETEVVPATGGVALWVQPVAITSEIITRNRILRAIFIQFTTISARVYAAEQVVDILHHTIITLGLG
jgi:hypothetical protein